MFATLESTRTLVMTTNWGAIPELTVPQNLDLTEFFPVTYVGAGTHAPAWSDAFITTFGGELAVDFRGGPPQDGNNMAIALHRILRNSLPRSEFRWSIKRNGLHERRASNAVHL